MAKLPRRLTSRKRTGGGKSASRSLLWPGLTTQSVGFTVFIETEDPVQKETTCQIAHTCEYVHFCWAIKAFRGAWKAQRPPGGRAGLSPHRGKLSGLCWVSLLTPLLHA